MNEYDLSTIYRRVAQEKELEQVQDELMSLVIKIVDLMAIQKPYKELTDRLETLKLRKFYLLSQRG